MPIFEYKAIDRKGQTVTGTVNGGTADEAARSLAGQGLIVQEVQPAPPVGDPIPSTFQPARNKVPAQRMTRVASPVSQPIPQPAQNPGASNSSSGESNLGERSAFQTEILGPLIGKVNLYALVVFLGQLEVMIRAGIQLSEAAESLVKNTRNNKLRKIASEIKVWSAQGYPLSAVMERYPEVFSPMMQSIVRAGEKGGFLDKALHQIVVYIETEMRLRNLIRKLTFWPKVTIAASISVITFANKVISSVGAGGQIYSPLTDPFVLKIVLPCCAIAFVALRIGLHNRTIKYCWDSVLSYIPWIGGTLRKLAMAKFGKAFGLLHNSGLPIHMCFNLAAEACGNEYMCRQMRPAAESLTTGRSITEVFAGTGAFDHVVMTMVSTGEKTGTISEMLDRMSEYYADQAEVRATQAAYVLEAVLILALGVYVFFVLLTFYGGSIGSIPQQISDAASAE